MQQSQRAEFNPALEYAIAQANALHLPVVVGFALTSFPEANRRHYQFMLEGLRETERRLAARGIGFCIRHGAPEDVIPDLAKSAALLVGDVGYLRVQRQWRETVAKRFACPVVFVEGDVVVPVGAVSDHAEFAARTIRPKIHKRLAEFLKPFKPLAVDIPSIGLVKRSLALDNPESLCRKLEVDESVPPSDRLVGGISVANQLLAVVALAVGTTVDEPVVQGGQVVPGKRMTVTMSCDHRVIDGALGARWLQAFAELFEKPESLAL